MITSIRHCKAMIDAPQPLPETTCIFSLLRPQMAQDSCSPMTVARALMGEMTQMPLPRDQLGDPLLRITFVSCEIRRLRIRSKCSGPHSRM